MCELVLVSSLRKVHSEHELRSMSSYTLARFVAARRSLPLTLVSVVGLACSTLLHGCFGGQTGTEWTSGTGGAPALSNGTDTSGQESGSGTSSPTNPTKGGVCQGTTGDTPTYDGGADLSSSQVIAFVQAMNPLLVDYADGTGTPVDISVAAQSGACAVTATNGPITATVPMTLRLRAADGRFDLGLTGVATASADASGGVGVVEIVATRGCGTAPGWLDPKSCEIAGLDFSAYERVTIELSVRAQRLGEHSQLLGAIRVSAVPLGQCGESICAAADWVVVTALPVSYGNQ
jgi:hypothetical protein